MIEISSKLEGKTFSLLDLETKLKPKGYVIGGNWDYDHGSFDIKMGENDGYQFLRLPFKAVDAPLDTDGATVKLMTPFVLAHKYEDGMDEGEGYIGNFTASFNQFAEPENPDAEVPQNYVSEAKKIVQDIENLLLS